MRHYFWMVMNSSFRFLTPNSCCREKNMSSWMVGQIVYFLLHAHCWIVHHYGMGGFHSERVQHFLNRAGGQIPELLLHRFVELLSWRASLCCCPRTVFPDFHGGNTCHCCFLLVSSHSLWVQHSHYPLVRSCRCP